jgi:hypothetical protein
MSSSRGASGIESYPPSLSSIFPLSRTEPQDGGRPGEPPQRLHGYYNWLTFVSAGISRQQKSSPAEPVFDAARMLSQGR